MPGNYWTDERIDPQALGGGFQLEWRGRLALLLIEKWGMITGTRGMEDSQGRATLDLLPVREVVDRAVEMAEVCVARLEERGWVRPLSGSVEEILTAVARLETLREQAKDRHRRELLLYEKRTASLAISDQRQQVPSSQPGLGQPQED